MKVFIFCLSTVVAFVSSTSVFAQSTPVDASNFDVAGVRLGMTADEAVDAISRNFGVPKSKIDIVRIVSSVSHKEVISSIKYVGKNELVLVDLELNVPINSKYPMIVESVSYSLPRTEENVKALASAAIKKYGPPTIPAHMHWCLEPASTAQCKHEQAVLSVAGNMLMLHDFRYVQRRIDYMKAQQRAVPNF